MSSGAHTFFRFMVKRVIAQQHAFKPKFKHNYIIDLGHIKIKLFDKSVPKTCHNFTELCTHNQGFGYTGTVLHNIVRGFGMHGGDCIERHQTLQPFDENCIGLDWHGTIVPHGKAEYLPMPKPESGMCGRSVYGKPMQEVVYEDETYFDDEKFDHISHDKPGIVTMANHGPNTNTSKFVILTAPAPYLDGKNVAFGEVVEGMDMLYEIDDILGTLCGIPTHVVEIVQSGVLENGDAELPEQKTLRQMNTRPKKDEFAYQKEPIYLE